MKWQLSQLQIMILEKAMFPKIEQEYESAIKFEKRKKKKESKLTQPRRFPAN